MQRKSPHPGKRQLLTAAREFEKLSRGELLSASLIDIGFISGSMVAEFVSYLYCDRLPGMNDRNPDYPGT